MSCTRFSLAPLAIILLASATVVAQERGRTYFADGARLTDGDAEPTEDAGDGYLVARAPEKPAAPKDLQPPDFGGLTDKVTALDKRLAEMEKKAKDAAKPKLPSVTINGVFQADGVALNQTTASRAAFGPVQGGADFRRARLSAKGAVAENMNYFVQMDFGFFGRPTFTDVWADFTKLPYLGNVRVGQWKQPFGLEVVSSFRYTTMMERSAMFQPFDPFRHMGVGYYNHSEDLMWTWAGSYYRSGQDQFGGSLSTRGGNGFVHRLTHLLYWDECCDGYNYLHVGGAYNLNQPPNNTVRYRAIPEIFVGEFSPLPAPTGTTGQALPGVFNGTPFFVDTGNLLNTSLIQQGGLEALYVRGPLSVQTEGIGTHVDRYAGNPNAWLYGGYCTVGYFLTGEHRPYDRKAGAIDRVIPFNNFDRCAGGIGAWEVAARVSHLNLNDANVLGGRMTNMTLGVNWYVNPYCKCVFNYIRSWADTPFAGNTTLPPPAPHTLRNTLTDFFGVRCQLDF